jgi:hypothetical protein
MVQRKRLMPRDIRFYHPCIFLALIGIVPKLPEVRMIYYVAQSRLGIHPRLKAGAIDAYFGIESHHFAALGSAAGQ